MKKKYFAILMILILMINFYPQKSYASAPAVIARVAKGTVGEKVVISLMEKQGMKFATQEAREKAVASWNFTVSKRAVELRRLGKEMEAQELANFQDRLARFNASNVTELPDKKGFGNVLIKGAMWAVGADIVHEIYQAYEEAKAFEKNIEIMKGVEEKLADGEYYTSVGGFTVGYEGRTPYIMHSGKKVGQYIVNLDAPHNENYNLIYLYFLEMYEGGNSQGKTIGVRFDWAYGNGADKLWTYTSSSRSINISELGFNPMDYPHTTVSTPIRDREFPEFTPIGFPPGGVPEEVPLTIPIDETVGAPYPWNDPITEPNPNPNPNPNPEPNPELNPQPEENPLPNGNGTEIPTEQIPPSSDACKSPAESVLEFLKNWIIGNFACFDWDKLKMAGGFFTNKFPFSLPWDIGRGLDAVFGGLTESDKLPEFPIKIADWEGTIKIPSFFHSWFPILRIMILVMFDISLIYAVRKLLGGAS